MRLDSVEEVTGYDEVDESTVFNGGYLPGAGKGPAVEDRRRGKKPLSQGNARRSRQNRSIGGGLSFGRFSFNIRGFEDTARTLLAVSIGALVLCALILFGTFYGHVLPAFYGSLAASVVVMALLFFTASRLAGGN